jgi:hypothetical protein
MTLLTTLCPAKRISDVLLRGTRSLRAHHEHPQLLWTKFSR